MTGQIQRMSARLSLLLVLACNAREVPQLDGPAFQRDPPQIGSLAGRVLTTNNGDDTLSVLDPAQPGPPKRLPVGFSPVELEGPHHLSVDPAGRFVYVNLSMAVAGSGSGPHGTHGGGTIPGYVVKIDVATARAVAWAQVDRNPGDNALSPDGRTLYVTHYDLIRWIRGSTGGDLRAGDSNLVVVDTETMSVKQRIPLCPAAHGVRLTPDGNTAYATCGPDEIAIVDLTARPPVARRVLLPASRETTSCDRCPYALAIAPDGTVWVSCLGAGSGLGGRGSLQIFDPRSGQFDPASAVALRGSPVFATFVGAAGSYRAYVPEQGAAGSVVRVYEPGTPPREVQMLALEPEACLLAHMLVATPDGARGFLICEGDHRGPGNFVWMDLPRLTVIDSVRIGVFPDGVALVP